MIAHKRKFNCLTALNQRQAVLSSRSSDSLKAPVYPIYRLLSACEVRERTPLSTGVPISIQSTNTPAARAASLTNQSTSPAPQLAPHHPPASSISALVAWGWSISTRQPVQEAQYLGLGVLSAGFGVKYRRQCDLES